MGQAGYGSDSIINTMPTIIAITIATQLLKLYNFKPKLQYH